MMRKVRMFVLLIVGVLAPAGVALGQAQSGFITGRVVDRNTQLPVPDVLVTVVGTTLGARTSEDGTFRISGVPSGTAQVRAARIGFTPGTSTVRVNADGTTSANFSLSPTVVTLDATIINAVTGGVERRREVGANVANIRVTDVEKGPIIKLTDVLVGRTAGVTMQGTAGTTGTSQRIRIRGANSLSLSNEPLIFMDGIQVTNSVGLSEGVGGQATSRLNDLNPSDIENIEVIKGPAASAIYGTAAANGVLLITTKRGRSGRTSWNVFVESGSLEDRTPYQSNYYPYGLATPGAPLLLPNGNLNRAARPACFNFNLAAGLCTRDSVATFNTLTDSRTTPLTRGDLRKVGVSVAGGSDVVRYYVSADREQEHGVISYNTFAKTGFRANLNANLGSKADLSVSTGYFDSKLALNSNDNSIFSPLINGLVGSAFYFDTLPDGKRNFRNYRAFTPEELEEYVALQDLDRFTLSTVANYQPLSWLRGNLTGGLDFFSRYDHRTLQPNRLPIAQSFTIGNRGSTRTNSYLYTGNGSLEGKFNLLRDLASTSSVGAGYNRNLLQNTNGFGAGIVEGTRNLGATSSLFAVGEGFSEVISVGGFIRQQLAWKDRMFLSASVRGDDNSAFGVDFGFIYYPAVNFSWVLDEESWFPNSRWVSNFRVRAAQGRSGLRPDFRDAVTFFSPVAVTISGAEQSAVTLASTGTVDLKPEKTDEFEFGFDAGLLDGRFSLEFTHFNKRSRDALISRRLPPSLGLTGSVIDNLGRVRNRGTEISLDARVFDTERTALSFRVTSSMLRNRIEEIGEGVNDIIINRGNQRHREGYSAGAFFQRPVTINDANGDGLVARSEVTLGDTAVYLGDALPRYNRSISGDLKVFRIVRISTLFEARGGNKQLNFSEQFRCTSGVTFGDRGCSATGNPQATLREQAAFLASRFGGAAPSLAGTSQALYIEDGSFVKWRELAVTVDLPAYLLSRMPGGVRGASITFAGRNLKLWTDYTGLDPEIVEAATSNFNQSEFNTQPPVRYLTARLNLNF